MNWTKVEILTDKKGLLELPEFLEVFELGGLIITDPYEMKAYIENPDKTWDFEAASVYEQLALPPSIVFYVAAEETEKLEIIKAALKIFFQTADIRGEISVFQVADSDWADKWKENYKPIQIGSFTICPAWEQKDDRGNKNTVYINPGHVFGTGQHESTQYVLEFLDMLHLQDKKVADIGCGSGILSIAALHKGAKKVLMTEIEENSEAIIHENMSLNQYQKEMDYNLYKGDISSDPYLQDIFESEKIDICLINIVADVILKLIPVLTPKIQENGMMLLSGIIDTRKQEVLDLLKLYFSDIHIKAEGGWVAMLASNALKNL